MSSFSLFGAVVVAIVVVILIAYGLVIVGLRGAFFSGQDVGSRLEAYVNLPDEANSRQEGQKRRSGLMRWRLRLNNMLSGLASEKLNLQLISANWPITETEYVTLRFFGTILAFGVAMLFSHMLVSGLGLAVIVFFVPDLLLRRAISQRRMHFGSQLVDVLVLITGAVRSGYSLPQAIEVVSKEMKAPASEEFRRVRHEIGLGLSLGQALNNLVARMENDDLYLMVTAININSQVGGNIVTMLEAVTSTIRERVRLFSEARVLTAQQRFGSYVLTFLPIGMGGALFVLNPHYMMRLFEPQIICIPIGAVLMIILGNFVVNRMGKIEV